MKLEDVIFLEAICNQIGAALETSQLWEELTHKEASLARLLAKVVTAQEEERKRISRELHDETGQALTTLLIQLKVCEGLPNIEAMREKISDMRKLTSQAVDEVHRLAVDLRPAALDDLGLVPAVDWYINEFIGRNGIEIQFVAKNMSGMTLPHEIEIVLYRVIQESLTNAARHSEAKNIWVDLVGNDGIIVVTIRDDGCGFNVNEAFGDQSKGVGILGIQERVELIGGVFDLQTKPGEGTLIRVETRIS